LDVVEVPSPSSGYRNIRLLVRLQNPGQSGATDGYACRVSVGAADVAYRIEKITDSAFSDLELLEDGPALAEGDTLLCRVIGNTITFQRRPASGSFTDVISATDSTHASAGYVGVSIEDAVFRLDNLDATTLVGVF